MLLLLLKIVLKLPSIEVVVDFFIFFSFNKNKTCTRDLKFIRTLF